MKDKKVSTKLTISFFVIIVLTILVGIAGVIGMVQINRNSREMFVTGSQPLADLGMAREYFQRLRVQLRDTVLATGNLEELAIIEADLINHERVFLMYMESYRQTLTDPHLIALYDDIMYAFSAYQPSMQQVIASARVDAPPIQMILMMNKLVVPTDFIMEALDYLAYAQVEQTAHTYESNTLIANALLIMIVVVIAVCVGVGLFITKNVAVLSKMEFSRLADENAALDSLNRMKTFYVSNLSHETKTPLTIISVHVQKALHRYTKNSGDDEQITASLRRAQEEIMRISRLSENALKMSSLQEAHGTATLLDLAELLRVSTEATRGFIEKQGNTLNINVKDNLASIMGKADQIISVMLNILTNASNHTKNGNITVYAQTNESDLIVVTVTDTGTGIPAELLPHVFERGVSGMGGTGFGLPICKDIIESHGGFIEIKSKEKSLKEILAFA